MQLKKPNKKIHDEITHKGCRISYTVSDYGSGSSGFSYITFFTENSFAVVLITLKYPTETLKEAKAEIIKRSKEWINSRLIQIGNKG